MVFLFGGDESRIATLAIPDACPKCGAANATTLHLFQNYAHVFSVPIFSTGKSIRSGCVACNAVFGEKTMPASWKSACDQLKAGKRAPIWIYSGLGFLVIVIGIIVYTIMEDNAEKSHYDAYLQSPAVGDFYEIRMNNNAYSLYRVESVADGVVQLRQGLYEKDGENDLDGTLFRQNDSFSDRVTPVDQKDLGAMYKNGKLVKIFRK